MILNIKKSHTDAKLPAFANHNDAGLDLYAIREEQINPGEKINIETGIAMEIPVGYAGLIWDKSSMANKVIHTLAGVIDSGYRGNITILLINLSQEKQIIRKGQKIAQMLIQKFEKPQIIEVTELTETKRGDGGFGSTGIY